MMASRNQQLTLFECLAVDPQAQSKQAKLDRIADKQSRSDSPKSPGAQWGCATNEEDFGLSSIPEDSSRESEPSANSSCLISGNQTNNITFHYPTGPTTAVVNSLPQEFSQPTRVHQMMLQHLLHPPLYNQLTLSTHLL